MIDCGRGAGLSKSSPDSKTKPITASEPLPPSSAVVLAQLQRVLESPSFRTSKRCSTFLRQVVEWSCQGKTDLLKERTLGVTVFQRDPDYDTNQDPVVRSTAGEVRKRLAQYYCEPGRDQEIRIDLPAGAYVPEITAPPPLSEPEPIAPVAPDVPVGRTWPVWGSSVAILLIAVLGALTVRNRPSPTPLDQFWAPLLEHSGPVTLCVGQPHVYKLKGDLDPVFEPGATSPEELAKRKITLTEVIPYWNRYISLGDAQTLTQLVVLFTNYKKELILRGGRTASLTELRGKPSVLIGAFNNRWTMDLTGELRYRFREDSKLGIEFVEDRQNLGQRTWQLPMDVPPEQVTMDYAIVTRVFNKTTEQAVVVVAGITRSGTNAAGELLTNKDYFAQAVAKAPAGWEKHNMQIVLTTRVYGGNPGPPQVVATHFW